jgi:hypothetical protein
MKKSIIYLAVAILSASMVSSCKQSKWVRLSESQPELIKYLSLYDTSIHHELGSLVMVPDEETAIKVAEVYLFKLFGKAKIEEEQPYQICNIKGYWFIMGTMPKKYIFGGYFEIVISAKTGEVVRLSHGK